MYVVLLTGGLASGKGTVCDILAEYGAEILDADTIAKDLQNEEKLQAQITAVFGEDVRKADGTLDRQLLAKRAFINEASARKLNEICWPAVGEYLSNIITKYKRVNSQEGELLVVQIPLLAEAPDFIELADEVISVEAPEDTRYQRAINRGMLATDAKKRLDLQASDEQRRAIADTVFDNSGSPDELKAQVYAWHEQRRQHFDDEATRLKQRL